MDIDQHLPCTIIVSSGDVKSTDLIKRILDVSHLAEPVNLYDNINGYKWQINTKYYTADTLLCPVDNEPLPEDFAERVEAVVIFFDSNDKNALNHVTSLTTLHAECYPDVQLLVCEQSCNDGIPRSESEAWCLTRKFEFIELNPKDDQEPPDSDALEDRADDIIPEKKGIARVIEALQAHTWLNLKMKDPPKSFPPAFGGGNDGIDKMLDNLLNDGDSDEFSELFAQLGTIKESVQSLPPGARRAGAEQVVTAFWRAIGGNEDEIADITQL